MQRSLPPGIHVEPVSQVSLLALALISPSLLGGSIPMGGGGAAPLGLLARVLVGGVHVGAIFEQELVVGRSPHLRVSDRCDAYDEGCESPSEVASKVQEVLDVVHIASLSVEDLEVP